MELIDIVHCETNANVHCTIHRDGTSYLVSVYLGSMCVREHRCGSNAVDINVRAFLNEYARIYKQVVALENENRAFLNEYARIYKQVVALENEHNTLMATASRLFKEDTHA